MSTINHNRMMHKVPPLLRLANASSNDVFDPQVVSIGPYHHGNSKLEMAEKLKPIAVQMFLKGSNRDEEYYVNKILGMIDDIRSCYVEVSTDMYNDVCLAKMMFQDGCFLFKCGAMWSDPTINFQVGRFLLEYAFHDMILLENQIPLSVLKVLNYPITDGKGKTLLDDLITTIFDSKWDHLKLKLGADDHPAEDEPLHLLEICRRACYLLAEDNNNGDLVKAKDIERGLCVNSFRSVMDLKARGVYFKVNKSSDLYRLEDIKFNTTCFHGEFQLPKLNVTIFTKVYLSNLISLENYLPRDECRVTSFVNIMKILLQNTNDVRELREKKVIRNQLRNDEDLVKVFYDLPITTWNILPPFSDVLKEVEVYYSKETEKWVAELIQTYFRTPWTTMALIAAALLLCLTMIQAYYAIHPNNPKKTH